MQEIEILTTHLGELVATEIDDVKEVEYIKNDIALVAFFITMHSGKSYLVAVSDVS